MRAAAQLNLRLAAKQFYSAVHQQKDSKGSISIPSVHHQWTHIRVRVFFGGSEEHKHKRLHVHAKVRVPRGDHLPIVSW